MLVATIGPSGSSIKVVCTEGEGGLSEMQAEVDKEGGLV